MEVDLTGLTFLADLMTYQGQPDELCLSVPAGISSPDELLHFLQENLGLPLFTETIWAALHDPLVDWSLWALEPLPRRLVLIHSDIPLLGSGKRWWIASDVPLLASEKALWNELEGYLRELIRSSAVLQRRKGNEPDPHKQQELVVIFPESTREEIQTILTRPPDWEVGIGFASYDDLYLSEFDPSESEIVSHLTMLNGVTAQVCTLSRKDLGIITVQYLKEMDAYCVRYKSADEKVRKVASREPDLGVLPTVSLAQASHILETFFRRGEVTEPPLWLAIEGETYYQLDAMLDRLYYWSDEEALLEQPHDNIRETIGEGVTRALGRREDVFSLEYWQGVLLQPECPLTLRLAAICVMGRSQWPDAPSLLRPFLHSPIKQERWVSSRFLGVWHEEEALPILLSMLMDELPLMTRKDESEYEGLWYDYWRWYAPRLLRSWEDSGVTHRLRKALGVWIQAEPQFNHTLDDYFNRWLDYEKRLCYELGYREDFTALAGLDLEDEHRDELLTAMKRGYYVKQKRMTAREEYDYLKQEPL